MPGPRIPTTARIEEVLIYFTEPHLLLLTSDRDKRMLAVAVERHGIAHPFFACEARDKPLERYFAGTADLQYVFKNAVSDRYYFVDIPDTRVDEVELVRAEPAEANNRDAYWPAPGLFSRSHTSPYNLKLFGQTSVETFKIDGTWGPTDFSRFHNKMSDLYAFFGVLKQLDGAQANDERAYLRNAVQSRFWQGGGSYGGFYDDLIDHLRNPLEVERIQYASPGVIAFRGDKELLDDVAHMVEVLTGNFVRIHTAYGNLRGLLSKAGLLRARPSTRIDRVVRRVIMENAAELANMMRVPKADEIHEACDRNALVHAKVVLSIFRRVRDLYNFHDEGRIQSEDAG